MIKITKTEKFQFRNKKYDKKTVINNVYKQLQKKEAKKKFKEEVEKGKKRIPPYDKKKAEMYGDVYTKERKKQRQQVRKDASTKVINDAFSKEIQGGTSNNPYAPTTMSKVNKQVLENTLEKIQKGRVKTVRRNYSERKKD